MSSRGIILQYTAQRKRMLLPLMMLAVLNVFYFVQKSSNFPASFAPQQVEPAVTAKPAMPETPPLARPAFDAVSADNSGMLIAAGRGPAGFELVLKSGTQIVGETRADESGEWLLTPKNPLSAGSYLLTLEAKDAAGATVVSAEKTITLTIAPRPQASPRPLIASATPTAENKDMSIQKTKTVAIRRGDTLWALARRHFGHAMRYPEIAAANIDQIKNPNLIFPRQQIAIPQK